MEEPPVEWRWQAVGREVSHLALDATLESYVVVIKYPRCLAKYPSTRNVGQKH